MTLLSMLYQKACVFTSHCLLRSYLAGNIWPVLALDCSPGTRGWDRDRVAGLRQDRAGIATTRPEALRISLVTSDYYALTMTLALIEH